MSDDTPTTDQALREQIATEIERDIIPDLHDNKGGFCPDCWAVHEAARIARGEQE